jgi:hypothetical protein
LLWVCKEVRMVAIKRLPTLEVRLSTPSIIRTYLILDPSRDVVHLSDLGTKVLIDPLQCHSLSLHQSPLVKKMGPTTLSQKKNLGVAISCDMRRNLWNRLEEVERIIKETFAPRMIIFIRDYKPKEEDNEHVRVELGNRFEERVAKKSICKIKFMTLLELEKATADGSLDS